MSTGAGRDHVRPYDNETEGQLTLPFSLPLSLSLAMGREILIFKVILKKETHRKFIDVVLQYGIKTKRMQGRSFVSFPTSEEFAGNA